MAVVGKELPLQEKGLKARGRRRRSFGWSGRSRQGQDGREPLAVQGAAGVADSARLTAARCSFASV